MDKASIEPALSLLEYWRSDPYPSPIANCHYLEPLRFHMVSYKQNPHAELKKEEMTEPNSKCTPFGIKKC